MPIHPLLASPFADIHQCCNSTQKMYRNLYLQEAKFAMRKCSTLFQIRKMRRQTLEQRSWNNKQCNYDEYKTGKKCRKRREKKQPKESPIPPTIKNQTCSHYQSILKILAPTENCPIEYKHYREKNEIFKRLECHFYFSSIILKIITRVNFVKIPLLLFFYYDFVSTKPKNKTSHIENCLQNSSKSLTYANIYA